MLSDQELQAKQPELYRVARENATEAPGSGEYLHTDSEGIYHCAVCEAPLFSSKDKYQSSSWPSFKEVINNEAIITRHDSSHGMERTEVRCASCDAHLGHVFRDRVSADGSLGDRYCINSISLDLVSNTNHEDN